MPVSGKDIVRKLKKMGWIVTSQRGSHVKLRKNKKITIVPVHGGKDLPRGTIKAIERQTGEKIL